MTFVRTFDYMDHVLAVDDGSTPVEIPDALLNWLSRLRLLYGIPFDYFVPNSALLPPESVRFFYIDRNWTDRLVDGALSVGKTTTREFAHHQLLNDEIVTALDREEGLIRAWLRSPYDDDMPDEVLVGEITGMLVRSELISSYPGLEVKAYPAKRANGQALDFTALFNNPTLELPQLPLLRMDRLAPDVLLCFWRGIPKLVRIEEPREGLQFGVDGEGDSLFLKLRHVHDRGPGQPRPGTEVGVDQTETVPQRSVQRRVLNISALRENLERDHQSLFREPGESGTVAVTSAELATQLLQFPFVINFFSDPPEDALRLDELEADDADSLYVTATLAVTALVGTLSEIERDDLIQATQATFSAFLNEED